MVNDQLSSAGEAIGDIWKTASMKSFFISVCSWVVGLSSMVLVPVILHLSFPHINSGIAASLAGAAFIFSLSYGPSLSWLKARLGEDERAYILPLTSSLILNLPVFLVALLAIGRTLLAAEAYALMVSFAAMGATFGLGFVWNSPRPKRIREPIGSHEIIAGKQALASRAT